MFKDVDMGKTLGRIQEFNDTINKLFEKYDGYYNALQDYNLNTLLYTSPDNKDLSIRQVPNLVKVKLI
jgi:hypothetical protein